VSSRGRDEKARVHGALRSGLKAERREQVWWWYGVTSATGGARTSRDGRRTTQERIILWRKCIELLVGWMIEGGAVVGRRDAGQTKMKKGSRPEQKEPAMYRL
jgi:IS1 family transposase